MGNDMQVVAAAVKEPKNKHKVMKVLKQYDGDNRGYLNGVEFRRFAINFVKILGKASGIAMNTPKSSWKFPNELYKMVDTDGNHQISFDELYNVIQIRDFWELAEKLHEFNPDSY